LFVAGSTTDHKKLTGSPLDTSPKYVVVEPVHTCVCPLIARVGHCAFKIVGDNRNSSPERVKSKFFFIETRGVKKYIIKLTKKPALFLKQALVYFMLTIVYS